MIFKHFDQESTLNPQLKMLSFIRLFILLCQAIALFYYSGVENIGLPINALVVSLTLFAAITILGWIRTIREQSITTTEFTVHLGLEILALTLIFYFAGGAANPFVSYYLVGICIAATVLPASHVFAVSIAAILAYSLLIFFYVPNEALMPHSVQSSHGDMGIQRAVTEQGPNLHLVGMWVNFLVSALLVSYFVVRMAGTISNQREQITRQREQQLEDDRLISIATHAASAAHELGTPLNSIHLLSKELNEVTSSADKEKLADQLYQQANICKKTLNKLVDTANQNIDRRPHQVSAEAYFRDLFERWQLIHPETAVTMDFTRLNTDWLLYAQPILEPMIFNLLNNAAQANAEKLEIEVESNNELRLRIRDFGRGFSKDVLARMGQPFNTDKESGMGIGLYLAKNAIDQIGGSLEFADWDNGTETIICLPRLDGDLSR